MRTSRPDRARRQDLLHCPALSLLSREALGLVFASMEAHEYAPGENLMTEGSPADFLFLVTRGAAIAWSRSEEGPQRVATFGPGDLVGEMALVTRGPRSATVVADTDVSALALPLRAFHDLATDHPELGVVLTHLVAERLGEHHVDGLGGKLVKDYRIRQSIGRGSMGVVYEAIDTRTEAPVALKMMSHRLLYEPGGVKRFQHEADTLLLLDHPNVARLYERFEALGTWFIAMQLCSGPTLGQLLRKHALLPESEVRKVVGQIASALGYIHEQGVIHRDLKPENVLTHADGLIRLTDFGLAKNLNPMDPMVTTGDRPFLGTPLYMAPEQIAARRVTGRADVYALACIAMELLDGRLPFDPSNFATMIMSKMTYALPAREDIGAGISTELHEVLGTALAHEALERTTDLAHLATWAAPIDPIYLGTESLP